MDLKVIGICAALVSALAWAGGAILYKKIGESASSFGMNVVKSILSLALLGFVLIISGIDHIETEALMLLAISGLLGIAIGDTLFFESLIRISPQVLLSLCLLGQALTVCFAVIFLGELLTIRMFAGICLVITGIATVLYQKSPYSGQSNSATGVILGLLSVIFMAASVIVAKKGIASVSPLQATFIRIASGTAGLLLWGLFSGKLRNWLTPFRDTVLIKKISSAVLLATIGGFWLFHVALKLLDVTIVSTLTATEPLFVIPLAAIFLKERIVFRSVLGTSISIGGVILLVTG